MTGFGSPGVHTGTVHVDGGEIFVREVGRGPPLVIVHGGPGTFDHTYLLPYMDRLAADCRLIYYDQRFHGASSGEERAAAETDMATFLRDLDAVREHAAHERVAVLGHSWGGQLAMRYAIEYPQRVTHLILLSSSPATKDDYDAFTRYRRSLTTRVSDELAALRGTPEFLAADPSAFARAMRLSLSVGFARAEDVARLELRLTTANIARGRAVGARFGELIFGRRYDLTKQLASLRVPTLVLHGDHDFIPVEAAERIASTIPGTRLVVVPECGHFGYLEAPEIVHREIVSFLRA
jgi:proline iminopeptidase